jgi:hypothetical protein
MMTFANDILEAAGDESILAIAVGPMRRQSYMYGDDKPDHDLGAEPISWDKAFPVINYSYDTGYGGQDCHDIWAWTETRVLFVHEYDGSTSIASAPRNPAPFVEATQ